MSIRSLADFNGVRPSVGPVLGRTDTVTGRGTPAVDQVNEMGTFDGHARGLSHGHGHRSACRGRPHHNECELIRESVASLPRGGELRNGIDCDITLLTREQRVRHAEAIRGKVAVGSRDLTEDELDGACLGGAAGSPGGRACQLSSSSSKGPYGRPPPAPERTLPPSCRACLRA